jgi:lysozyme
MRACLLFAGIAGLFLNAGLVHGQKIELVNDVSRRDLFQYSGLLEPSPAPAIPEHFTLPDDTKTLPDWVFGIDVSHYDGEVDWALVPSQGVTFVYVKATQGANTYDGNFAANWNALARQTGPMPIYRGAYHFFSADVDAEAQAKNFMQIAGPAAAGDLPACLDLEWDLAPGNKEDRFSKFTAGQIVYKAKTWLAAVEQAAGGRKPIIYTNKAFWHQRGLDKAGGLEGYEIWIADYSEKSLLRETPKAPAGVDPALWQFSSHGRFAKSGIVTTNVDVSLFKGNRADFAKKFALPE